MFALGLVPVMADMLALGVTKTVTVGECVLVDDAECDLEIDIRVPARVVDCLVDKTAVGTDSKRVEAVDGRLRIVGVGVKIRVGVGVKIRVGVGVPVLVNVGLELFKGRS